MVDQSCQINIERILLGDQHLGVSLLINRTLVFDLEQERIGFSPTTSEYSSGKKHHKKHSKKESFIERTLDNLSEALDDLHDFFHDLFK